MANTAANTSIWNAPNYVGELYLVGANQTPFLNMLGGLQGGNVKLTTAFPFPVAQPWALNSASQPSVSETAAMTAPTAWTYVRGQDLNTCQIIQKTVTVSYAKQSSAGQLYSTSTSHINASGPTVTNELDFQIEAALKQAAIDTEYSFLRGTYAAATSAAVAAKTQGICSAVSTNTVAAGGVRLSKSLMNQLLRTQAANGSQFGEPVVFCNAFQKQMISDIYGYAPTDRNVGGVNIKQIETDFAMLGVVWAPQMATSTLLVADMSVCAPVWLPVPEKGLLFYETLAILGAGLRGHLYGQCGLDYGPEEMHGTITGLATS